uniref:Uncharacterized protein n=1 Tax=Arundo donax TaxID=35708 RepID=A0A0A9ECM1_ARUDO
MTSHQINLIKSTFHRYPNPLLLHLIQSF